MQITQTDVKMTVGHDVGAGFFSRPFTKNGSGDFRQIFRSHFTMHLAFNCVAITAHYTSCWLLLSNLEGGCGIFFQMIFIDSQCETETIGKLFFDRVS